jgi:hypothetical protein
MRWLFAFFLPPSTFLTWLLIFFNSGLVVAVYLFPHTRVEAQQVESPGASPVEFSARLVWTINGRTAKAQLFVKNDRYRIEHMGGVKTELGYAGVTIVRLDEQKVWYVFSQRRMVVSVPLTSDYLLPFSVMMEGETERKLVGDSMVGDRSAVLYELVVQDRLGRSERFFQWVDSERNVLLKLLSQDRDWFVEYGHVVLSPQPDYYFDPPLGYRMIEAQEAFVPRG